MGILSFMHTRSLKKAIGTMPVMDASRGSCTIVPYRPRRRIHYGHTENIFLDAHNDDAFGAVALTSKRGHQLLHDPMFNKGTGFMSSERERLGLRGLVPPRAFASREEAMKMGAERVVRRYRQLQDPIQKWIYLQQLDDRNSALFQRVLIDNIEEMAPIVYTPTVGLACQSFGAIFRRPRGMYFSAQDQGEMHAMVYNFQEDDIEVIVVTDGSRILGLGDLGINGMGISIGKLSLYIAAGGFHPSRTLPVVIDVGTNNKELLQSKYDYLGLQHPRLTGKEYYDVVAEFVSAVTSRWPNVLIQWEDFHTEAASTLLSKYRKKVLSFNDDIQGTGAVGLAGLITAMRAIGDKDPRSALTNPNLRIIMNGAGSAGLGVASAIFNAMVIAGLSPTEARNRFYLLDVGGLLGKGRSVPTALQAWVRDDLQDGLKLPEVVRIAKPCVLFGLTGQRGLFTKEIVQEMAKHCERPVLFALSNPTSQSEVQPADAYEWTDGKAIVATGSPFPPVELHGKIYTPAQLNNVLVFPGVGLGSIAVHASEITNSMFYAASLQLAALVSDSDLAAGKIFPSIRDIRDVSLKIAIAVATQAFKDGVAQIDKPDSEESLQLLIASKMWNPQYAELVHVSRL